MPGTVLIDHTCPHCGHSSSAPSTGVSEGPAGIWCCEQCDSAFRVNISLELIEPSGHHQRVTIPDRSDRFHAAFKESEVGAESEIDRQRLLELYGESLYLRGRLQDLRSEIAAITEQSEQMLPQC